MEDQDIVEAVAQRLADGQRARRRRAVVDLGIAFVDDQNGIVSPRPADWMACRGSSSRRAASRRRRANGCRAGNRSKRRPASAPVRRRPSRRRPDRHCRRDWAGSRSACGRRQGSAARSAVRPGTALPWCPPRARYGGRHRPIRPSGYSAGSASRRWRRAVPACPPPADTCPTNGHWLPGPGRSSAARRAAVRRATAGSVRARPAVRRRRSDRAAAGTGNR